ncbi:MAG: CHAD domain-containing protein [Verrucomicrobia bacterium]|nr:CHAD domain-containing protein [Verrucomicrobiota bacterium]
MTDLAGALRVLCEKHDNEILHTQYVTDLALELFDLTRDVFDLPSGSRALLETAGILHDIGYAVRQDGHAEESAHIILSADLPGIPEDQRRMMAAIAFLHSGKNSSMLDHEVISAAPDKELALRLGAILRVADAMDHSHLQDASIESVTIQNRVATLTYLGSWYRGVHDQLEEKADLWRRVLPVGLAFVEKRPGGTGFEGVVRAGDSALETCRRLLVSQYRIAKSNVPGAIAGVNPEHLHDVRVALRRCRSAIALFKPLIRETGAEEADRRIQDFNRRLGSARDTDVWIEFLKREALIDARDKAWKRYMESQEVRARNSDEELRPILESDELRDVMKRLAFLVRIELPRLIGREDGKSFRKFAARRLRKTFKRIAKTTCDAEHLEPEELHRIRRLCRRERYWAEFTAPVLGKGMQRLAGDLKLVTASLGDVHDMDVHIEAIETEAVQAPESLRPYLSAYREGALGKFAEVWKKFHGKKYLKTIRRQLKKGAAE